MKQLIVVLAFIALGLTSAKAQTSFSCSYRTYCDWNEEKEIFEDCEGYDESSLFVMNASETMFTHTIETMKSTYYVDSKEYDEVNDVYTYDVTSDVGNKYYYIFDPVNKQVRAVFLSDGKTIMLTFTVKAMF